MSFILTRYEPVLEFGIQTLDGTLECPYCSLECSRIDLQLADECDLTHTKLRRKDSKYLRTAYCRKHLKEVK